MSAAGLALQTAIHAALVADAGIGAIVGDRIFDAVPRVATFPYVTLGDARAADWSTGTEPGAEHRVTLHVWSRARGKSECWAVLAALQAVLHDAALALEGHALINLRVEAADVGMDRDGITWHGVVRLRAVTEPN